MKSFRPTKSRLKLKRAVGAALAGIYFATQVCTAQALETNFWAERRKVLVKPAGRALAGRSLSLGLNNLPHLSASFPGRSLVRPGLSRTLSHETLPEWATPYLTDYADVEAFFVPPHKSRPTPLVILLQDVHDQREAQQNLKAALLEIEKKGTLPLIGLEGAQGGFIQERLRQNPRLPTILQNAEKLMEEKILTGPEVFGFATQKSATLWGVEDAVAYLAQVRTITDTEAQKPELNAFLTSLTRGLGLVKRKVFSPGLLRLEALSQAYTRGQLDLSAYVTALRVESGFSEVRPGALSLKQWPQLALLSEALRLERDLNWTQLAEERTQAMSALLQNLAPAETQLLTFASGEYRKGRQSFGELFSLAQALGDRHAIPWHRFPVLMAYARSQKCVDQLRRDLLMGDLSQCQQSLEMRAAATPLARKTLRLSRDVELYRKCVDHQLRPDEWGVVQGRRSDLERLSARLSELAQEAGVECPTLSPAVPLQNYQAFYEWALARNDAMVDNLLKAMDDRHATTSALVAGGFHGVGLRHALEQRGIATLVLTPRLNHIEKGGDYFSNFTRGPRELERLLLGERVLVQRPLVTAVEPLLPSDRPGSLLPLDPFFEHLQKWMEFKGWIAFRDIVKTSRFVALFAASGMGLPLTLNFVQQSFSGQEFPVFFLILVAVWFLQGASEMVGQIGDVLIQNPRGLRHLLTWWQLFSRQVHYATRGLWAFQLVTVGIPVALSFPVSDLWWRYEIYPLSGLIFGLWSVWFSFFHIYKWDPWRWLKQIYSPSPAMSIEKRLESLNVLLNNPTTPKTILGPLQNSRDQYEKFLRKKTEALSSRVPIEGLQGLLTGLLPKFIEAYVTISLDVEEEGPQIKQLRQAIKDVSSKQSNPWAFFRFLVPEKETERPEFDDYWKAMFALLMPKLQESFLRHWGHEGTLSEQELSEGERYKYCHLGDGLYLLTAQDADQTDQRFCTWLMVRGSLVVHFSPGPFTRGPHYFFNAGKPRSYRKLIDSQTVHEKISGFDFGRGNYVSIFPAGIQERFSSAVFGFDGDRWKLENRNIDSFRVYKITPSSTSDVTRVSQAKHPQIKNHAIKLFSFFRNLLQTKSQDGGGRDDEWYDTKALHWVEQLWLSVPLIVGGAAILFLGVVPPETWTWWGMGMFLLSDAVWALWFVLGHPEEDRLAAWKVVGLNGVLISLGLVWVSLANASLIEAGFLLVGFGVVVAIAHRGLNAGKLFSLVWKKSLFNVSLVVYVIYVASASFRAASFAGPFFSSLMSQYSSLLFEQPLLISLPFLVSVFVIVKRMLQTLGSRPGADKRRRGPELKLLGWLVAILGGLSFFVGGKAQAAWLGQDIPKAVSCFWLNPYPFILGGGLMVTITLLGYILYHHRAREEYWESDLAREDHPAQNPDSSDVKEGGLSDPRFPRRDGSWRISLGYWILGLLDSLSDGRLTRGDLRDKIDALFPLPEIAIRLGLSSSPPSHDARNDSNLVWLKRYIEGGRKSGYAEWRFADQKSRFSDSDMEFLKPRHVKSALAQYVGNVQGVSSPQNLFFWRLLCHQVLIPLLHPKASSRVGGNSHISENFPVQMVLASLLFFYQAWVGGERPESDTANDILAMAEEGKSLKEFHFSTRQATAESPEVLAVPLHDGLFNSVSQYDATVERLLAAKSLRQKIVFIPVSRRSSDLARGLENLWRARQQNRENDSLTSIPLLAGRIIVGDQGVNPQAVIQALFAQGVVPPGSAFKLVALDGPLWDRSGEVDNREVVVEFVLFTAGKWFQMEWKKNQVIETAA